MGRPAVVFVNKFVYSWHVGSQDYSDYINRASSQIPILKPDDDNENDYYGYMSRAYAQNGQMKFDSNTEYTTIFDAENDFLTKSQIEHYRDLERQSQSEGCPKYIPVMSFDNQFLMNNGLMPGGKVDIPKIKDVSRKAINTLIHSSKKLDPQNTYWTADIHVNTDNIHVHFSLLEYHRLVDRKKVYARKGMDMIEQKAFEDFKSTVANSIILEKRTPALTKFKRENLIPEFASSVTASKDLLELIKKLPPPKPKVGWQYSRKDMLPYHEDINKCIDHIILSNENLRRQFNHYKNSLQTLSDQYTEFYGNRVDPNTLTYCENQMNDFYVRAGNQLLQALITMRDPDAPPFGVSKKGEKEKIARVRAMERDGKAPDAVKYLESQDNLSPYLSLTLGRLCLRSSNTDTEQKGVSVLSALSVPDKQTDLRITTSANAMLGNWYLKKGKRGEAEKYLTYAAEREDVRSQYQLAKLCLSDDKPDMSKAMSWLQRSADNGYSPAQCALGLSLIKSYDKDKALYYLNLADKQGNVYAHRFIERSSNDENKKTNDAEKPVKSRSATQKSSVKNKIKPYQARKTFSSARRSMSQCWYTLKQLLEEYERHLRELQEEFNEMNNLADAEFDIGFDYEYTI